MALAAPPATVATVQASPALPLPAAPVVPAVLAATAASMAHREHRALLVHMSMSRLSTNLLSAILVVQVGLLEVVGWQAPQVWAALELLAVMHFATLLA